MTAPFSYLMLDIKRLDNSKYSGFFARFLFKVFMPKSFSSGFDASSNAADTDKIETEKRIVKIISSRFVSAEDRLKLGEKCKLHNRANSEDCLLCKITSIASILDNNESFLLSRNLDFHDWETLASHFPNIIQKCKKASTKDNPNDEDNPVYLHQDCSKFWHTELIPYSRRVVNGVQHDPESD
jgi:hypothetical protein